MQREFIAISINYKSTEARKVKNGSREEPEECDGEGTAGEEIMILTPSLTYDIDKILSTNDR